MINDLKELEKLLKLCRKQGVTSIKVQGIELLLGELPRKSSETEADDDVKSDEPTPEDIMNWSIPRENLQG